MDINRRGFIFASGAFAASLAGGVTTAAPRLKVGIVSDTHIQDEASARHFEMALRYFRDRGVDAVMHVGDISDWGLISAWRYASEAWERGDGGYGLVAVNTSYSPQKETLSFGVEFGKLNELIGGEGNLSIGKTGTLAVSLPVAGSAAWFIGEWR